LAIGEVQVELNNYRAEYGRNGGPVVNIVTKSGSRQYKGSAYWYKRHERLNANDFFNNRNGVAKPVLPVRHGRRHAWRPGAAAEAAARDKLFFFYSFDGMKSLNPLPLQQARPRPRWNERGTSRSRSMSTVA
jgi:hypothetical protein